MAKTAKTTTTPPATSAVQVEAQDTLSPYDDLSRDQLVRILKRRDRERRFGLVWERPPQEEERAINEDYVALDFVKELSVGAGAFEHMIIEGDNFDALRALKSTHAGKVKVILIDPPYNTGKRDFVYNDRFVDRDHKFRHSVWIEFMYRRLVLAKELLRDDGVIFVNIGDEEFGHLSMLMDQVFPGMRVGTLVWRTREGANDSKGAFFSQDHEYVLCYAGPRFQFGGQEKNQSHYSNPDDDPLGPWYAGDLTVACRYTEARAGNCYYPLLNAATGIWYPCNPDRVWAYASEERLSKGQRIKTATMEDRIRNGRILWPTPARTVTYATMDELRQAIQAGTAPSALRPDLPDLGFWVGRTIGYGRPQVKKYQLETRTSTKPLSSWILATSASEAEKEVVPDDANVIESSTSREATQTVKRILGEKRFSYPKPVSLYRALIEQATDPASDDIVLDFFAGSGTTGHAVLELNAADGGGRRFILVSNTEATDEEPNKNICRDVCRERVARVMTGYTVVGQANAKKAKVVPGLGGSLAYLRAVRIPREKVAAKLEHQWVWLALQLMHTQRIDSVMKAPALQSLAMEDADLIYVPEIDSTSLRKLKALLTQRHSAIVYSWRPGVLRQDFFIDGVVFEKIPDVLMARFGGNA